MYCSLAKLLWKLSGPGQTFHALLYYRGLCHKKPKDAYLPKKKVLPYSICPILESSNITWCVWIFLHLSSLFLVSALGVCVLLQTPLLKVHFFLSVLLHRNTDVVHGHKKKKCLTSNWCNKCSTKPLCWLGVGEPSAKLWGFCVAFCFNWTDNLDASLNLLRCRVGQKEKVLEMVMNNVFDIKSFPVCVHGSASSMFNFQ